jgi:hypothetical protein
MVGMFLEIFLRDRHFGHFFSVYIMWTLVGKCFEV